MGLHYIIWIGSLALFFIGWYYSRFIYVKYKTYFVPYILFQLGISLFVISIFIVGGWAGMGLGFVSLLIMGVGLLVALFIFILSKIGSNISVKR